jgi:hypothetical protein
VLSTSYAQRTARHGLGPGPGSGFSPPHVFLRMTKLSKGFVAQNTALGFLTCVHCTHVSTRSPRLSNRCVSHLQLWSCSEVRQPDLLQMPSPSQGPCCFRFFGLIETFASHVTVSVLLASRSSTRLYATAKCAVCICNLLHWDGFCADLAATNCLSGLFTTASSSCQEH